VIQEGDIEFCNSSTFGSSPLGSVPALSSLKLTLLDFNALPLLLELLVEAGGILPSAKPYDASESLSLCEDIPLGYLRVMGVIANWNSAGVRKSVK